MFKNAKIIGDGIAYSDYARQPDGVKKGDPRFVMSRGGLVKLITKCPKIWLESEDDEKKSDALKNGSLIDTMVLQLEKFDDLYTLTPATYQNSKGETADWTLKSTTCRDWVAAREADGVTVISQEQLDTAEKAVGILFKDPMIAEFIACSKKQVMVTAEYHDSDTGVIIPVRVLTDLVPDHKHPRYGRSLGDLKTSRDASPYSWEDAVYDNQYCDQAWLNLAVHQAATPDIERSEFRHLIQENKAPWITARRLISLEFIEIGKARMLAALKLYAQCLKHKFFPDFEIERDTINGWTTTNPRSWMSSQFFEKHVVFPQEVAEQEEQKRKNPEMNFDTQP